MFTTLHVMFTNSKCNAPVVRHLHKAHVVILYSYSEHAEFCELLHLLSKSVLHCCISYEMFFFFKSPGSHGEFVGVHVLPLLPGVQHSRGGTQAPVDMHCWGWPTTRHIWRHSCHCSGPTDTGKYWLKSTVSSVWYVMCYCSILDGGTESKNISNVTMWPEMTSCVIP